MNGQQWVLLSFLHASPQLFSEKPTGQVVLPCYSKEESEAQKGSLSGILELDLNAVTALSDPAHGLLLVSCGAPVPHVFVRITWTLPGHLLSPSLLRLLALQILLLQCDTESALLEDKELYLSSLPFSQGSYCLVLL